VQCRRAFASVSVDRSYAERRDPALSTPSRHGGALDLDEERTRAYMGDRCHEACDVLPAAGALCMGTRACRRIDAFFPPRSQHLFALCNSFPTGRPAGRRVASARGTKMMISTITAERRQARFPLAGLHSSSARSREGVVDVRSK
jgi:hypothetical protein